MRSVLFGASLALLAACGSTNPFMTAGSGDPATGDTSDIPDSLRGDLSRFSYSAASQTLTVEGVTLDNLPFNTIYARNAALDVPGYQAYTAQNDPLDRHSTAFVMQSGNSGSVRAGVVVTGGQFNRYFGGTYYERDGGYTPPTVTPTSGLVSYAGNYAGLTNVSGDGGDLLPVPLGTDPSLIPRQSAEVTGQIFLNVDFADGSVNGAIYNRTLVDAALALPDIALIATDIAIDGTFHGTTVEYVGLVGTDIGDYGGIFGGPDAEAVGGGVRLEEWDGENDALGFDNEEEYGVFVLDQCGTPDANAPVCASVNP